jgi:hypothetical protein
MINVVKVRYIISVSMNMKVKESGIYGSCR